MQIKVGTFNLNNLFGRFNFRASIKTVEDSGRYSFEPEHGYWLRTFKGKLVKEKPSKDRELIAQRILSAKPDVLAVQEVEDRDAILRFVKEHLNNRYPFCVVIDGNDPRLIDVGVISQLPLGAVTSWQHWVHPAVSGEKVFSRDLLQVEVLAPNRQRILFTLFVTHSKSQYVDWRLKGDKRKEQEQILKDNALRRRQSEAIVEIVSRTQRPDSRYLIAADLNDVPNSSPLEPLLASTLNLENLVNRLPGDEQWTTRHKEPGQEPKFQLFDYLLASPRLASKVSSVEVKRRKKSTGDGSDHDPLFAVLTM